MIELYTVIKLRPDEVGRIQACIRIYREIVPDDEDMEKLEKRFSELPYVKGRTEND